MLQKEQFFILINHDVCKKKLKYQNISYIRVYEKAELQFYEEKKFVKANLNNVSILLYLTAICKSSPQKQFLKKTEDEQFLIKKKW